MSTQRAGPASIGLRGHEIRLRAADGHEFGAYRCDPDRVPVGRLVVLQEIFGINRHIREVCDRFAGLGYATVSPALFDRSRRDTQLGYDPEGIETGRRLRAAIEWDDTLRDVQAALDELKGDGPVAALGYCWGGTLAFLAACRLDGVCCAVSYYGGQTIPFAEEAPGVPVIMYFGEFDPRVPRSDREIIHRHNPQIEMHVFPADHGFNCDHRKEFHRQSADKALEVTLEFLRRNFENATLPASE